MLLNATITITKTEEFVFMLEYKLLRVTVTGNLVTVGIYAFERNNYHNKNRTICVHTGIQIVRGYCY